MCTLSEPIRDPKKKTQSVSARITVMWEWWYIVGDSRALSLLLAIACFLAIAITSCARGVAKWKRLARTSQEDHQVPTLEGNELYYARTRWPVYDARFNLRLSLLHGPVVRVRLRSTSLVARLMRSWMDSFLRDTATSSDTTVLINSLAGDNGALRGLLNACASRAPSLAAGKYLSRGRRIVLMPYGPEWLRHRKAFASLLTREKVKGLWAEALRFEAMVLVDRLAEDSGRAPDGLAGRTSLADEVSRFTASTVLQIAYARRAATPDDPVLRDLEVVSQNIAGAFRPGRYWAESFPVLDVFPALISPWKRKLNAHHAFEKGIFRDLLQDVEDRISSNGEARAVDRHAIMIPVEECAAAQLLPTQVSHGLDRDAVAYLAAGLLEAGTETTAMTINAFLLGAACNPEYTRRAQAEMDSLMTASAPGDRKTVPRFQDLEGLPLLSGFVKEALRLTPAGASGVGHTRAAAGQQSFDLTKKDRNGEGEEGARRLDVPSGATVLANIYGLHHDSKTFAHPWRFDPGRWLSKPDEAGRKTLDHTHACFAFGFGRRICPGSTLACYSLTMAIALLLLCFDFSWTDEAWRVCAEMTAQKDEEDAAWERLVGDGERGVVERERAMRDFHRSEEERVGSVLVDAHIAFKLSRAQLGACVRLVRREDGVGLGVVRDALAMGVRG